LLLRSGFSSVALGADVAEVGGGDFELLGESLEELVFSE